jgi:hypothetical protein
MTRLALFALTLAAAAAPALAQSSTILPGYWESTSKLSSFIISDTSRHKTCVRPDQVDEYLSGPNNRHYRCTYSRRHVANGRVSLSGSCLDKKNRRLDATVNGTYAPEQFHLNAQFRFHLLGVPIPGTAMLDARRVSDTCPVGAK